MIKYLRIALFLLLVWFLGSVYSFWRTPLTQTTEFTVEPGASITEVTSGLQKAGIIKHPYYFMAWAELRRVNHKLQAGEYRFVSGTTAPEVLSQIVQGRGLYRRLTLLEGWTFAQVLDAIAHNPYISHTLGRSGAGTVMAQLGRPAEHPEGRFFPDTYYFTRGTSDITLLRTAYREMEKRLDIEWQNRAIDIIYQTPYQALIAASLVEGEAKLNTDRSQIAGVLERRLQKNMRLQFDSSVLYGLNNSRKGRLKKSDLKRDTPYNTYLRTGLPPTPIGMPGLAAIRAVMHPAVTDALYFVAKADGSGGHQFSDSYVAHSEAVNTYKLRTKRQKAEKNTSPRYYLAKLAVNKKHDPALLHFLPAHLGYLIR